MEVLPSGVFGSLHLLMLHRHILEHSLVTRGFLQSGIVTCRLNQVFLPLPVSWGEHPHPLCIWREP